jgi:hypothetical protein
MTQIDLPPYRGSQSHLDLVVVEIIFVRFLKLFDMHLRLLVLEHRPGCRPTYEENTRAVSEKHPYA